LVFLYKDLCLGFTLFIVVGVIGSTGIVRSGSTVGRTSVIWSTGSVSSASVTGRGNIVGSGRVPGGAGAIGNVIVRVGVVATAAVTFFSIENRFVAVVDERSTSDRRWLSYICWGVVSFFMDIRKGNLFGGKFWYSCMTVVTVINVVVATASFFLVISGRSVYV